ncbi:MAG: hypothetical protein ACYDCH_10080 [Gaiellaceae bacterium]
MRKVLLLTVCAALAPAAAAGATTPPRLVARAVLTPAQVGKGYVLLIRKDSTGTATPTLNLWGVANYPSEKLRTLRIQVDYAKKNSSLGLSNEVVRYKPGGTAQAMREVRRHALHCPRGLVDSGQPGVPKFHFRFTVLHDKKLLQGALVLRMRSIGIYKGKKYDTISYAIYQVHGDVLSGVYSSGPDTSAQLRFALHAAEQSAKNLQQGGAPASGPSA